MIEVSRTFDAEAIKSVMLRPDMIAAIAEDGYIASDFEPNPGSDCWLEARDGSDIIGVFSVYVRNSCTLEIHVNILPEHRGRCGVIAGRKALKWLADNAELYHKVIAYIPAIHANIKRYAECLGFIEEGVNRASYRKNGDIHDQWLMGITFDEIRGKRWAT